MNFRKIKLKKLKFKLKKNIWLLVQKILALALLLSADLQLSVTLEKSHDLSVSHYLQLWYEEIIINNFFKYNIL